MSAEAIAIAGVGVALLAVLVPVVVWKWAVTCMPWRSAWPASRCADRALAPNQRLAGADIQAAPRRPRRVTCDLLCSGNRPTRRKSRTRTLPY